MREKIKRSRATLGIAGALSVTLWLAVGSAMSAPPASTIALGPPHGADYARDALGTFRPVDLSLVKELLGEDALGSLGTGTVTSTGTVTPVDEDGGGSGDGTEPEPSPTPTPTPTGPGPSPTPTPTPTGKVRDPHPILSVRMTASSRKVDPGEEIEYTIEVSNVGDAPAGGGKISTHVPPGTRYMGDDSCDEAIDVNPGGGDDPVVCTSTEHVFGPEQPPDHFGPAFSAIKVGRTLRYVFRVRVPAGAESGTWLATHAHATAAGARDADSRTVWVRVS